MLFLGFSAGLPFMLVFSTLSAWLREVGVERATIGMLSWVGIIYSIKFFWFERQFFRSISLWAMFQSPQST